MSSAAPKITITDDGEVRIERFSLARRLEHVFVILTFVTLVMTGFPQKFDDSGVGHWLLAAMGGLDNARLVHRVAGVLFAVHAMVHLGIIVVGALLGKIRLTLLPVTQDIRDVWHTLRYYFGYHDQRPQYPKFDYRQKFEYLGLVLGGCVMIASGLVLMFPVVTAHLLPADVIPAAHLAHSSEAMLALSVLVVWHIYAAAFSPEVFPFDRTMITGYLTAEQLEERHGREYRRLFPDGVPTAPTAAERDDDCAGRASRGG